MHNLSLLNKITYISNVFPSDWIRHFKSILLISVLQKSLFITIFTLYRIEDPQNF